MVVIKPQACQKPEATGMVELFIPGPKYFYRHIFGVSTLCIFVGVGENSRQGLLAIFDAGIFGWEAVFNLSSRNTRSDFLSWTLVFTPATFTGVHVDTRCVDSWTR
jgi:hypothetical protein